MHPLVSIIRLKSSSKVAQAIVERIFSSVEQALAEREEVSIVLAGGSSYRLVYEQLAAEWFRLSEEEWQRLHFFLGDERVVGDEDQLSNAHMIQESLLSRLPVAVRPIFDHWQGLENGVETSQKRYTSTVDNYLAEAKYFDICLLGIGKDAHTASIFPSHLKAALSDQASTIVTEGEQEPFVQRVSMTPRVLSECNCMIYAALGENKREAIDKILVGEEVPAGVIRSLHGTTYVYVDHEASIF